MDLVLFPFQPTPMGLVPAGTPLLLAEPEQDAVPTILTDEHKEGYNMLIRRLREDDISSLAHMVKQNWSRGDAEHFVSEAECSFASYAWRPHFYTAEQDGVAVGCAAHVPSWISWGGFSLAWVGVFPSKQGQGIGRKLVDRCIDDIRACGTLITLSTYVPEFYEKNWGFRRLQDFTGNDGRPSVLMSLDLHS